MADETIATGYLRLIPSVDGIQGAIGGEFAQAGTTAGRSFGASFGPLLAGIAVAGGLLLGRSIKNFVAGGVDALARIETIGAQTQNVIASTGGAAGVTAAHVNDLAQALERTTASEAETIQEGANLLLTFKNIRNEAGAGNDIFDQTVASMVDVGRAMGTDAAGAAIQLGKALNDPVAGISALTRVGITFTDQQKEQIRALTESGDLLGAQKIILQELNSQFGGSGAAYAETYAGKLELVKNAFGDVQEGLVEGLMPAFSGFLGVALDVLNRVNDSPTFQGIVDKLNLIGDSGAENLGEVVDLIERLSSGDDLSADTLLAGLAEIFPTLEPVLTLARDLAPLFPEIREGLVAIVEALTTEGVTQAIIDLVTIALPPLAQLLTDIAPLIPPIADLLSIVLPPAIALAQGALGLLTADLQGLEDLFTSSSATDYVAKLFESGGALLTFATGAAAFIKGIVNPVIDGLNGLGDAIEGFVNGVSGIFGGGTISIANIGRLTTVISAVPTPSKGTSYIPSYGPGMPRLAEGGTITRAGWTMVGEAGPELLNLDVGAQVRPLDNLPGGGGVFQGDLYLSTGEWLGAVRGEIGKYDADQRLARAQGSRGDGR